MESHSSGVIDGFRERMSLNISWEAVHEQASEEKNRLLVLREGDQHRVYQLRGALVFLKFLRARQEALKLGPEVCKQHPGAVQQHSELISSRRKKSYSSQTEPLLK